MKTANITDLKNDLTRIMSFVEKGEKIQIYRHDIPIAYIVPCRQKRPVNKTRLGCGSGSARIKADLTEPMISEES
ncbi:type II toxin-antitoxin system Phd/YefM family antitoxin [Desulfobacterales bacterium HSG16]|nr:type II toxin-antitoxin system Phd/YefM family antitoxin [Desulfobacterales bacterium HSG16]